MTIVITIVNFVNFVPSITSLSRMSVWLHQGLKLSWNFEVPVSNSGYAAEQGSAEIGLQFPISLTSSALYIDVTRAILSSSGKQPFWRDRLKIAFTGFSKGQN